MTLAILDVADDPVLTFRSTGPADEPLSAQVFSGQCRIGPSPREKLAAKLANAGTFVQLGFYVPQAGPLPVDDLLRAWAEVSLATLQVDINGMARRGPYGVDDAVVQLVDDEGDARQWPYLSFTAHGGEPMLVRYRVTVTQPART